MNQAPYSQGFPPQNEKRQQEIINEMAIIVVFRLILKLEIFMFLQDLAS